METLRTLATGRELGTLRKLASGSELGTLRTLASGSELGTLRTLASGSELGTLRTLATGSELGTLRTLATGSECSIRVPPESSTQGSSCFFAGVALRRTQDLGWPSDSKTPQVQSLPVVTVSVLTGSDGR